MFTASSSMLQNSAFDYTVTTCDKYLRRVGMMIVAVMVMMVMVMHGQALV